MNESDEELYIYKVLTTKHNYKGKQTNFTVVLFTPSY